jgi:hypothetical protein
MLRMALITLLHIIQFSLANIVGLRHEIFGWISFLLSMVMPTFVLQVLYDTREMPRRSSRSITRKYFDRGKQYRPAFAAKLCLYSFIMITGAWSCFYNGAPMHWTIRIPDAPNYGLISTAVLTAMLVTFFLTQLVQGIRRIYTCHDSLNLPGVSAYLAQLVKGIRQYCLDPPILPRASHLKRKGRHKLHSLSAFAVIASLSASQLDLAGSTTFDVSSIGSVIVDNCATGHICNDR